MRTSVLERSASQTGRDKVMSRADVAHFLCVSVGAVDAYCRQPEDPLPFRKVGRRVLFLRSEVEKWFEERGGGARSGRGGPRE